MRRRPGSEHLKRSGRDTPLAPGELLPPSPPLNLTAIRNAVERGEWPELTPPGPDLPLWLDAIEREASRILRREGFVAPLPPPLDFPRLQFHQSDGYSFPGVSATIGTALAALFHARALRLWLPFAHAGSVAHHGLYLGLAIALLGEDPSERGRQNVSERWELTETERHKRDDRLEQAYLALLQDHPEWSDRIRFESVAESEREKGHPETTARMVRTAVKGR